MKYALISLIIVIVCLSGMSYIYNSIPIIYTPADNQFAHEYATESLELMASIAMQGEALRQKSTIDACDYYSDQQIQFDRLKHAALFLKPDLAMDFVYAFALAQDWCKYASQAAYNPGDFTSAKLAQIKYQLAYQELQTMRHKEYPSSNQ